MDFTGTTAIVTGATSGIGAEFARQLSLRGAGVVLVGRRVGLLEDLALELEQETGGSSLVVPLDLAQPGAAARLRVAVEEAGWKIDTLINCAGAGLTKAFAETTQAEIDMQVDLDIGAVLAVTRLFLPDVLASGRGAIVNVGSLTGYMAVPMMAVYAAAKSFVIRFTEALAYEVRDSPVRVMVVSPGPTATEFFATSGTSTDGAHFQTPQQVVAEAIAALDKRRSPASLVSGAANRRIRRLVSVLPSRLRLILATSTAT
ncbi:SDR family NAD(P)-dependent oxidoreductase [Curtobacterium sp. ME26]|uniref:SDR family NAD(P)-dependent oxidoreductase n=1 Tax=Curtobacterium sp. ME26 TaxID=2744254 RepID=UPI0015F77010|nr:SDR family NAD(P)-dependent oxidoreductase [Curtobacterium sp. ME26]